jgi:hypothetical protein
LKVFRRLWQRGVAGRWWSRNATAGGASGFQLKTGLNHLKDFGLFGLLVKHGLGQEDLGRLKYRSGGAKGIG